MVTDGASHAAITAVEIQDVRNHHGRQMFRHCVAPQKPASWKLTASKHLRPQ
jgi:hypothetical protein